MLLSLSLCHKLSHLLGSPRPLERDGLYERPLTVSTAENFTAKVSFATIPWRKKQSNFSLHYHYFHRSDFYLHYNIYASLCGSLSVSARISIVIGDIAQTYFP